MPPTPAKDWTTPQPETVTLPSGNTADLQPPPLWALVAVSGVPRTLPDAPPDAPPPDPTALAALADSVVMASFVSPQVVPGDPAPDANQLTLAQVSPADRAHVLRWALARLGLIREDRAAQAASKSDRQPG